MVNCQNNTVTTQKVLESYIGEITKPQRHVKATLNFFITDNSFGHLWKLSSVGLLKLKNLGTKKKVKMLESHVSSNLNVVHHKWPKVSFLKKTLIRWCVESFKWIRFNMVNCQNNRVTTQKVLESYIGEILETLQNHKDVWRPLQTNFFHQREQLRSFVQSFKPFCWTFETFKNSGTKKKVVKC